MSNLLKDKNIYVIFSITLIAVMGVSSITPVIPTIMNLFEIDKSKAGWLITAFTLPGIFATPILGVLADKYGRKVILIPSLILFAVAGASITFVHNFNIMLLLRFFQGLGGASLGALNGTIIADLYSGKVRAEAMGLMASVLSLGTASFPFIGGMIAAIKWNYVFLLPLFSVPVILLIIFVLDYNDEKNQQKMNDYFIEVIKNIWKRDILILFIASLLTFIFLFGTYLVYFSILLESRYNFETWQIGIVMSIMSITTAFFSSMIKYIQKFINERTSLGLSYLIYGLSFLLIGLFHELYVVIIAVVVFGIAHGINLPTSQKLIADFAPVKQRGAFMAFNGTILRVGMTIGPLLMGIMYDFYEIDNLFMVSAFAMTIFAILMLIFFRKVKIVKV